MRRICLFSFYDERGLVDDYVITFLRELGPFVERVLFYSNGPLAPGAAQRLAGCVTQIVERPNVGYDVIAYKEGLQAIDFDSAGDCDEVLMVNHTCYGPLFPFAELFDAMSRRACDFWGISAHLAVTPNPLTGGGTLPFHLNANFIAVRAPMLRSPEFHAYWDRLGPKSDFNEAVASHEAVFTEHFVKLGRRVETYLDCEKYGTPYPAIFDVDATIEDRSPLLKRRVFFNDPAVLEHNGANLPRALRLIARSSDYDPALIWRNIPRAAQSRVLNTNAGLTSVLPDVRIKRDAPLPDCGRLAVCVHVYYVEMMDEILALTDTIPLPFDFIATTDSAEKQAAIEASARGRGRIARTIVRLVEENRGRDMSSLFITCRDLFLDGPYDLVCRLHTKKSPQVQAGRANHFKRHLFDNLLGNPGYTANVLDMFADNPWIGVAVPPLEHISILVMGHAWFTNRAKTDEVKAMLGLDVAFDPDTPIAAYGTMFWFRPIALRKLFAHPWKWTDFNAEPRHVDGGLSHALERIICYVAQDARYTTQQILSPGQAGRNYAMLEYKVQRLAAVLPGGSFSAQTAILEDWRRAGYPVAGYPVVQDGELVLLPPSLRNTLTFLRQAVVFALERKAPAMARLLRPMYRAMRGRRP